MLPLLKIASDGHEHSIREAREALSAEFELSEEEKKALLPNGRRACRLIRFGQQIPRSFTSDNMTDTRHRLDQRDAA